jgi:hypothetical protein
LGATAFRAFAGAVRGICAFQHSSAESARRAAPERGRSETGDQADPSSCASRSTAALTYVR